MNKNVTVTINADKIRVRKYHKRDRFGNEEKEELVTVSFYVEDDCILEVQAIPLGNKINLMTI